MSKRRDDGSEILTSSALSSTPNLSMVRFNNNFKLYSHIFLLLDRVLCAELHHLVALGEVKIVSEHAKVFVSSTRSWASFTSSSLP